MLKLKFRLDRKALETIALIRPILEYAGVVWCNITKYEEDKFEAAMIVTGTTKIVSTGILYKKTGWATLSSRRRQHKLTLYYKMSRISQFIASSPCWDY